MSHRRHIARRQDGFTLIELLVAISLGIVVTGALYAILSTTLLQTSRVFSRVDATQRTRLAMENIRSLLRSSCVSESVTPIQTGSTGSNLVFLSRHGGSSTLTPIKHSIALGGGNLVDTTYAATGGVPPSWTFSSTPLATNTLLTNVTTINTSRRSSSTSARRAGTSSARRAACRRAATRTRHAESGSAVASFPGPPCSPSSPC